MRLAMLAALAAATALSACATEQPRFRNHRPGMERGLRPGAGGAGGFGARLFVSPAGEPFRAQPGGPPPMEAWFRAVDANHDGVIDWAEFHADFVRYFAVLDTDHDGEIGPDEVAHYEQSILPEMSSRGGGGVGFGGNGGFRRGGGGMGRRGGGMGRGGMGRGGMARGGFGGGAPGGGMAMMTGAARFELLPIPHPIMDADRDLNRGVSRAEWDHAAGERFNRLDTDHGGRITLAQLQHMRAERMEQFMRGRGRGRHGPAQGGEASGRSLPPDDPDGGANPPG